MEGFPKPRAESSGKDVSAKQIEPVLQSLQEKLEEVRPILDGYELAPEQAAELSETLKDIQFG